MNEKSSHAGGRAGEPGAELPIDPDFVTEDDQLAALRADLATARETINRLNRRCQSAEAGLQAKLVSGPSFGRMLANSAAAMYKAQREEADAEIRRLRDELTRVMTEREDLRARVSERVSRDAPQGLEQYRDHQEVGQWPSGVCKAPACLDGEPHIHVRDGDWIPVSGAPSNGDAGALAQRVVDDETLAFPMPGRGKLIKAVARALTAFAASAIAAEREACAQIAFRRGISAPLPNPGAGIGKAIRERASVSPVAGAIQNEPGQETRDGS